MVSVEGRKPCVPSAITFDYPSASGGDLVRQLVREAKQRTQQLAEALEAGSGKAAGEGHAAQSFSSTSSAPFTHPDALVILT